MGEFMRYLKKLFELKDIIELNHWFVNDEGFSISLMRYYCFIDDNKVYPEVYVYEDGKERLIMSFSDLKYAFLFVEEEINFSHSFDEIKRRFSVYNSLGYGENIFDKKDSDYKGYTFDFERIEKYINKKGWYVNSKGYSITSMKFFFTVNDALEYPEVYIYIDSKPFLQLSFDSLKSTINFVEEACSFYSIDEVIDLFNQYQMKGEGISIRYRDNYKSDVKMKTKTKSNI
jgi:hypothetical protein